MYTLTAGAAEIGVGPFPPSAPMDERLRMANSHCPDDVLSFVEWGRTAVQFGTTVKGESFYTRWRMALLRNTIIIANGPVCT